MLRRRAGQTQIAAQVTGELYDIRAKLYRDENCFEETDPLILCAPPVVYLIH